jgi:hypothetical protein
VPEVRRLLLALVEPPERFRFRLGWSIFRRRHQAVAKQCHAVRRAGCRPAHASRSSVPTRWSPRPIPTDLTDEQWARIAPLLPPQRPPVGRPMLDHRTMLAGMLWIVGRGASWRELPDTFGLWNTVYSRYRRWRREGIWQQILEVLNVTTPTEVA